MAELGQQTVEFSALVRRAAEDSFISLKELVEKSKSSEQSDSEKKIGLLKYIVKTRQRMLRLHVLAKWCQQVPLVQYCQELASTLSSHDTCFTQAADSLFFMHEGLQQARAPIYDVPSAIEVLLTGNYQRLPKCIEDMGSQNTLTKAEQMPVLKKLDTLLRSKLLEVSLPKEITNVTVSDGTALLRVDGKFKVLLTLGYRGHLSLWRILHIELLVGEKNGALKLEEMQRHALGDDLERRMAASDSPFMILYSVLHELCTALIMDTVIRQVQTLRQGRWKDAIMFELISEVQGATAGSMQLSQDGESDSNSLRTPGLKLMYWLDFEKNIPGSDSTSPPFIKIEPGQDLQIKCFHSTFVVDPMTDNDAEFSLDLSCINVENLLLRAIDCNKHTRLLEIHKELSKNGQISQAAGDVILKCHEIKSESDSRKDGKSIIGGYFVDEFLLVRAYGSLYITLKINIRSGRFLLHSSRNILSSSTLLECEEALNQGIISAAEVFVNLRSKSILRLFASIGRFLGLKVYEQGPAAVKIPKDVLNGSDMLLLGFPHCGDSYYLLLQLDKDFKPLFMLVEIQPDPRGRSLSVVDVNQEIHYKKIDISQISMAEDELNLSLLDWEKVFSCSTNSADPNLTSEISLLSEYGREANMQMTESSRSGFSSVIDEVFELEKGDAMPSFPIQNHPSASCNISSVSQLDSFPIDRQMMKGGMNSQFWDGSFQLSQISSTAKDLSVASALNSSLFPSNNVKGMALPSYANSLSCSPVRSPSICKLSASKSEQELASIRSPHSLEVSSIDDDLVRLPKLSPKDPGLIVAGNRSSQPLSPLRTTGGRISSPSTKPNVIKSTSTGHLVGSLRCAGSSPLTTSGICQTPESGNNYHGSIHDGVTERDKKSKKRSLSEVLKLIPSLQAVDCCAQPQKKRKISDSVPYFGTNSKSHLSAGTHRADGCTYGNMLTEANHGRAPSNIYICTLLHVVRHCSLCIKHVQLTSQMDSLNIPYGEEVGLRGLSVNLWFQMPFARNNSWRYICLRLGRPGSMHWDVKVNDQHFKELWELQKVSANTPWGCGVRTANASDIDSHIRYDPEGVVLSYRTVEADSIQKLVADLRRLSNARVFALGMRKLLGVRPDDKSEDVGSNSGAKNVGEAVDRTSEQIRKAFKIEAVGLMSLWFSFCSMPGIVARFVVEWEAGKEGCTMHVSPDQLWPHTKFLEDFINGGEVASLLDCICLTAGPLIALAGAIRPARTGPVSSGVHSATASLSAASKQNSFIPTQGLLPSGLSLNANQTASAGNPSGSSAVGTLGNHNLQSIAMLSVAGRGGPGIVPSSLLPIDVSVVLRGPYWIRIIYRKNFSVDMRCFAGDQVWLQPATPANRDPDGGGSLPCPQFRPFIMENVAQGLSALEPNVSSGVHTVGLVNSSNPSLGSASQHPAANVNRATSTGGVARPTTMVGNQGGNVGRVSSPMLPSASLAAASAGLPLRVPASVPLHVRGELNTAFIGLGDDGGYGGGWVPLAALKKVLRGILKYLGVLWLFAQLPGLLKEILGSNLNSNEGALLNLDQEQPALRFYVGGYVFAVSVHRVQLLLQVLSVKRFHSQQQSQPNVPQEELAPNEISEICDYFSRRVASEPYDASRVASFITLLTLPISVLREFLKLIAWKKGLSQVVQSGEITPAQRPRIELCLENHTGYASEENPESSFSSKSNIHYDRPHNSVEFSLTIVLDPAHIPNINAAGGAAWLPYCVSVRLKYSFGENNQISLVGMEGSHGGRAWLKAEDWEKCKQKVVKAVEFGNGSAAGDISQGGKLRAVAEALQKTLQSSLVQLRDVCLTASTVAT